ncbi:MAG: outer membrane lipid asymmetry maintenance protein MlaD [Gammaproteobacteria bacterium]|nr:MAG: outer membrane lipid asymmetry maintenance protein MlaD [Gammaproteobacteria bacterium]
MQQTRTVELGTGLFVFLGIAALFFLTTQTTGTGMGRVETYTVTARFDNIGGLTARAPVTMAGVTIGRVEKIALDPERLDAVVTLQIDRQFDQIPEDSEASILTAGLLGGNYIGLGAGGSLDSLRDGDEIYLTQSALVLESLISRFLFSQSEDDDDD